VPFAEGWLQLANDEAWLLSDAAEVESSAPAEHEGDSHGSPIDSRRYGPVPVTALVGRAWLRYWPLSRIGVLDRRPRRAASDREAPALAVSATGPPEGVSPP
jgi:hypothetical protein